MPNYRITYTSEGVELIVDHETEIYLNHLPQKYVHDIIDKLDQMGDYKTLAELRDLGLLPPIKK